MASPRRALELLAPALATASLINSCVVVSAKKPFWNDELYSYYLLADPSFAHMLRAYHAPINNTPPLYFLLGWPWARVFGDSELSLRLFSSFGTCAALTVVWWTLRRTFGALGASVGALAGLLGTRVVLQQNAEARMYGLFLAIAAMGVFLYDRLGRGRDPEPRLLVLNAAAHAALVNTHLHGLFFSAAILAAQWVRDRHVERSRWSFALWAGAGWSTLLIYLPSFLSQSKAGRTSDWLVLPTLGDLIDVLAVSSLSFAGIDLRSVAVLSFFMLLAALSWWRSGRHVRYGVTNGRTTSARPEGERSLLLLAYALWSVPVVVWILSHLVKPIFWDRYLVPSLFARAILLAWASSHAWHLLADRSRAWGPGARGVARAASIAAMAVLVVPLLGRPLTFARERRVDRTPGWEDDAHGHRDLPIAMQFSHDFLERFHYAAEPSRYHFILDWEAASALDGGLFAPQEYRHMVAWRDTYPELFGERIVESEEFLRRHPRFLVLTLRNHDVRCGTEKVHGNGHCARWFPTRILGDPRYAATELGLAGGRKLWLVESKAARTPAAAPADATSSPPAPRG